MRNALLVGVSSAALACPIGALAGSVGWNSALTATNLTSYPWVLVSPPGSPPFQTYMWGRIEVWTGVSTGTSGMTSLAGVNSALLTFSQGNMTLVEWVSPGAASPGLEVYAAQAPNSHWISYNGTPILEYAVTSMETHVENVSDNTAIGVGSIRVLAGATPLGAALLSEIREQTHGHMVGRYSIENFYPVDFVGHLTSTGTLTFAPSERPADINDDGIVDGLDLGMILSAWGACDSCAADIDWNATVDAQDLAAVLANWG